MTINGKSDIIVSHKLIKTIVDLYAYAEEYASITKCDLVQVFNFDYFDYVYYFVYADYTHDKLVGVIKIDGVDYAIVDDLKEKSKVCEYYNQHKTDDNFYTKSDRTTKEGIEDVLDGMKDLLFYKNEKYGDSALKPVNTFYKGDSQSSICIRLDDKLQRVKNSSELRVNDICDIIGYCTLLLISKGVTIDDIEKLKD